MGQYATKEQLKEYLKDDDVVQAGTVDVLLDAILIRCSRALDTLAKVPVDGFTANVATLLFDGRNTKKLFPQRGIVSVTTLEVKLDGTQGTTWTAVPAADYFLEPATKRPDQPYLWIELADFTSGSVFVFPKGKRTVRVNGTWDRASIPTDIEEITLELAVRTYRARGSGFGDMVGLSTDQVDQLIITKALPALGKDVLKRFTRESVFA